MKNADQRTKDIINGFIRNVECMLAIVNEDNAYYNIPSLVFMITMLYYYNPEYFTIHGQQITVNEDKNIAVALLEDVQNTVYGHLAIGRSSKGKHIWIFDIIKPNKDVLIAIGIDSSSKSFPDSSINSMDNESSYYAYQCWAGLPAKRGRARKVQNTRCGVSYGVVFSNKASQIKMELNMDNKTLKYYIDGEDQGTAFDNICFKNDEKYSMSISMDEEMCIKLSDYQHVTNIP